MKNEEEALADTAAGPPSYFFIRTSNFELHPLISELGFRTTPRYVVRGLVLSSASSPYPVGSFFNAATRLEASFMSPNTMASVGHACAQAVVTSPSRTRWLPPRFSASILASLMRCTQ